MYGEGESARQNALLINIGSNKRIWSNQNEKTLYNLQDKVAQQRTGLRTAGGVTSAIFLLNHMPLEFLANAR